MTARRNGWSRPLHVRQCVLIAFVVYLAILYHALWGPAISQWLQKGSDARSQPTTTTAVFVGLVHAVHELALLAVLISSAILISSDPADPNVQYPSSHRIHPEPLVQNDDGFINIGATDKQHHVLTPDESLKYCYVCQVVVHPSSLHCRYCDKCVIGLDHHCFFANNCVGLRNYGVFVAAIVSSSIYNLIHTLAAIFALVYRYTIFVENSEVLPMKTTPSLWTALACSVGVPASLLFIFTTDLIRLHTILWTKQMTTLEYSKYLRDRGSFINFRSWWKHMKNMGNETAPNI